MSEIRILTVRQPWAWAIIHGGKDVENRVRNIAGDYRGPVAIHVSQTEDVNAFSDIGRDAARMLSDAADAYYETLTPAQANRGRSPWWSGHGHIIGVADLRNAHEPHVGVRSVSRGSANGLSWGTWARCSDWAEADAWHLVFANPRPLRQPVPFKGGLGLRRFDSTLIEGAF